MLPVDIVFVRHGQSEGNLAVKASLAGDNRFFTPGHMDRHSRAYRLTDLGIEQARRAGAWLKQEGLTLFDRHYVSDYIRAKETAVHLEIPNAGWRVEYQLRERDKALMDNVPPSENATLFEREQRQYELDPFLSYPAGGGESIASHCLRLKADFLAHLARDCSDKRVIVVCHGHVMRALQLELLQMGHDDFIRLDDSEDPKDRIRNCQVMWYTRRDPDTGRIAGSRLHSWRSVTPWDPTASDTGWQKVERRTWTNDDLAADVARYPRHAN